MEQTEVMGAFVFQAEAARLGVSLDCVLPHLQVGVLDEHGHLAYSLRPFRDVNHVDIRVDECTHVVEALFTVCDQAPQWGCWHSHSYPLSQQNLLADLCAMAVTHRTYNEFRRMALEAMTLVASSHPSEVTAEARNAMMMVGCLLATYEDASVREQATDLLIASASMDTFDIMKTYFRDHKHPLGERVLDNVMQGISARVCQQ